MNGAGKISLGLIQKSVDGLMASGTKFNTYRSLFELESGFRQAMIFKKESGVWHLDTNASLRETRKLNPKKTNS